MSARHVADDQHRSFRKIHGMSSEAMYQMMVSIAASSFQRPHSEERINKTRFLQLVPSEGNVQDTLTEAFARHAISGPSASIGVSPATIVTLCDSSTLPKPSAYVAVSYCWERNIADWYDSDDDPPILVKQPDCSTKRSGIPPDVFYRALSYAQSRDITALWIDQECINQDDPADKEEAIQAMDMIYEESAYPVAILESWFDKQEQVDVFASITDPDLFEFDPDKIEALADILEDFVLEKWFTRAWTLQESTSSGVRMVLLIGCPDLSKPDCFGSNPDEFEISVWDFQQAMINARGLIERSLANHDWEDPTIAISASNFADILWNRLPTDFPTERDQMDDYRQQCSAAQAITFMAERYNSVFSDRLAILANLCNYEIRIDSKVLEDPSASFSTSALTLAILNGDMSLLVGYEDEKRSHLAEHGIMAGDQRADSQVYMSDHRDSPRIGFGFTWGPKPTARLSRICYIENDIAAFRLQPSTLSVHGLQVRGVLWHVDQEIDVQEHNGHIIPSGRTCQLEILAKLIPELIRKDYASLAESFWAFLKPWGVTIRGPDVWMQPKWVSFPFEEVFGSSALDKVSSGPQTPLLNDILEEWPLEQFIPPERPPIDQLGPQASLAAQVCQHGSLPCARPISTVVGTPSSKPLAWFESTEVGDLVFTPFTALGDDVAVPPYRYQAVSWAVQRTGKIADGCETLRCIGRRRGYFRLAHLNSTDYVLE